MLAAITAATTTTTTAGTNRVARPTRLRGPVRDGHVLLPDVGPARDDGTRRWNVWCGFHVRHASFRIRPMTAATRNLSIVSGMATTIQRYLTREHETITSEGRWQLIPPIRLPTNTYDLVKSDPPAALLRQVRALSALAGLSTQCAYTNALVDEQAKWKMPPAQGQVDQLDVIVLFHKPIMESVNKVVERLAPLQAAVRKAGKEVGGLNLHELPQEPEVLTTDALASVRDRPR